MRYSKKFIQNTGGHTFPFNVTFLNMSCLNLCSATLLHKFTEYSVNLIPQVLKPHKPKLTFIAKSEYYKNT